MRDFYLADIPGVVHVGANSGQERHNYAAQGLRVIWVEANPEIYAELVANIAGFPQQKAFCALLSDVDGREYQLTIGDNSGLFSSIFAPGKLRDIWPEVSFVRSRILRSVRLDTLFQRENISVADYPALVLDVEGAELLVLQGSGRLLAQFRLIRAEAADFESYIGGVKLPDLNDFLVASGFVETERDAFAHHPTDGHYWDVIWKRQIDF